MDEASAIYEPMLEELQRLGIKFTETISAPLVSAILRTRFGPQ